MPILPMCLYVYITVYAHWEALIRIQPLRKTTLCKRIRVQWEFSILEILDESQLHFFSLDHEIWFSKVSISSRNMRVTIFSLVLVSKYENGHMIISISSRQMRARKKFSILSQKIEPSLESEREILNPTQLQGCTEGNHMKWFFIDNQKHVLSLSLCGLTVKVKLTTASSPVT